MRTIQTSPILVTFAYGGLWNTIPCDTEEQVEAAVQRAREFGGERGIVVWDKREARESRIPDAPSPLVDPSPADLVEE